MSDPSNDDMDKPLTKREALELFHTKQEMRDMFAHFLDAILARIDERFSQQDARIDQRFAQQDDRFQRLFKVSESRLTREMREQLGAIDQDHLDDTKFEDKYKGLPERVTKLEAAVFPPQPAKRQRRR